MMHFEFLTIIIVVNEHFDPLVYIHATALILLISKECDVYCYCMYSYTVNSYLTSVGAFTLALCFSSNSATSVLPS